MVEPLTEPSMQSPHQPSPSRAEVRAAMRGIVRQSLRPVALGLALMYLVTAASHALRLTPPAHVPLTSLAVATCLAMAALLLALRRWIVPDRWVNPLAAGMALLVLLNELALLYYLGEPSHSIYVCLYSIGVGMFFLSGWWFTACVGLGLAGWLLIAWHSGSLMVWVEFAYPIMGAVVLAGAIHVVRLGIYRRLESLRLRERSRQAAIEQANRQLKESEQRFRQFAEQSDQVFWINEWSSHRLVYVNPAYERLTGRPIAELQHNPMAWSLAIHPDDRPRVAQAYLDKVARGAFDEQYRIQRPDGAVRWVRDHGFPIRDVDGHICRVAGIVEDITAYKQIELSLRRSESRFRNLFEHSPDAILVEGLDGRVLDANPAACRLHGVTRKRLIGSAVPDLVPRHAQAQAQRDFAKAAEGALSIYESWRLADDGRGIPVEIRVNAIEFDQRPALLLHMRDITDRRQAEQELRASEQRFRLVAMATSDAVFEWDVATDLVWRNESYQKLFGEGEPMASNPHWWRSQVHPDDRPRVEAAMQHVLESNEQFFGDEYRFQKANGDYAELESRCYIVRDEAGKPVRVIGALTDISQRKQAERDKALLEAELRQAQKLEAVGTLASGVAHDFNNLLTAIDGYSELARQRLPAGHAALGPLDMIRRATEQAGGVTRSLLTFAQRMPFEKSPADLAQTIRDGARLLRRLLPASIELKEQIHANGDLWVNADANQLQQVLMNLAINARDAMPDGGTLTIDLTRMSDVPARADDSWVGDAADTAMLTVRDTGIGMTEQVRSRIFEPFFTTKPRGQGTGLGLSIIHGIVSDHGGRVRVKSRPGAGTVVRVYLPTCQPPAMRADPEHAAPLVIGHGEMILLAEDDEYVRAIVATSLRDAGYDVVTAADGDQALEQFRRHRNDASLIVLDLDLPKRTGEACLEQIRADRRDMPVVIITADAHRLAPRPAHAREAVLAKPFQIASLIDQVSRSLEQARHN